MTDFKESATSIVGLTAMGAIGYVEGVKTIRATVILISLFALSSCGLAKSAVQLPVRTVQSVGRAVGL